MEDSQKDAPNRCPNPSNVQQEMSICEDEINLIDYLVILWKRKYFIVLASVLPALVVWIFSCYLPRDYKTTYVYDVNEWGLNERNFNLLLDRFYSEENIDKIVISLRGSGLGRYAELISETGGITALKKLVDFEALPSYMDLSQAQITDPAMLQQIRQLEAQLLRMNITAKHQSDILKISSVIRDNFENVIPVYLVEEELHAIARGFKAEMADIEENRFNLALDLKMNELSLDKLKSIEVGASYKSKGDVTLQFDIGDKSEYLPVGYQIQANEFKIIQLGEEIAANEEKYNYYGELLALNEKLLVELKNKISSSYYTLQQFHLYLNDLVGSYDNGARDYLNSYIKKIENRISANIPIIGKPKIYPIGKSTVKKSATVFVVALMISVFAAFLLEGVQKSRSSSVKALLIDKQAD